MNDDAMEFLIRASLATSFFLSMSALYANVLWRIPVLGNQRTYLVVERLKSTLTSDQARKLIQLGFILSGVWWLLTTPNTVDARMAKLMYGLAIGVAGIVTFTVDLRQRTRDFDQHRALVVYATGWAIVLTIWTMSVIFALLK